MKRMLPSLLALGLTLLSPGFVIAGQLPFADAPAQSSVRKQEVRFLFPQQVTVAANKTASVDLHFRIEEGLHINSHSPREEELIPTNLTFPQIAGVKVVGVEFPSGSDYSPQFSPNRKLSVYAGEFVLKVKLDVQPGDHLLQGGLRYQACNTNSCYPPRTIPVVLDVQGK